MREDSSLLDHDFESGRATPPDDHAEPRAQREVAAPAMSDVAWVRDVVARIVEDAVWETTFIDDIKETMAAALVDVVAERTAEQLAGRRAADRPVPDEADGLGTAAAEAEHATLDEAEDEVARLERVARQNARERDDARAEVGRLRSLIHTPRTDEFFEAVRTEAAHQVERWGVDHDAGKAHADWHSLVATLLAKSTQAYWSRDWYKRTHHLISAAAALLNWHRHVTGVSQVMRPGVAADHERTRASSNLDLVDPLVAREGLDR